MARPKRSRQHSRVREKPAPRYTPAEAPETLTGVLLDSDVIIEVLRGNERIDALLSRLEDAGVPTYCTAVSWAEVYAGLRPGEGPVTDAFFEARGEVILDARAGRQAGAYLALHARSHGLGIADALIAAASTTSGLRLWTLNRRHYPMHDVRFYEPGRD
jgi:predicted nucleic acid-binding protein